MYVTAIEPSAVPSLSGLPRAATCPLKVSGSPCGGADDPQYSGGPACSFGGRQSARVDEGLPGPGSYTVAQKLGKGGVISSHVVKSELEFALERAATQPGPGEYEHGRALEKGRSSTISGRTRNAQDFELQSSARRPGPGTYDPPEARVRGGVMLLNGRTETSLPAIAPGPGSYHQTPTTRQEKELRELSRQVVRLVKHRQGGHSASAPEMLQRSSGRRARARAAPGIFEAIAEAPLGV